MTRPHVVVIVQARMGSTWLPSKVLIDHEEWPMLERQPERLAEAGTPDAIVVATTTDARDRSIVDLAEQLCVPTTRGSEEDVLDRYVQAARAHEADVVVRVTSDRPLIDPSILDECVDGLLADDNLGYVSNTIHRTYPRGLDVEAIRTHTLEIADRQAAGAAEREHVTRFIWRQPGRFNLGSLTAAEDNSRLRWTVDVAVDLALVRRVFRDLHPQTPRFGYTEILEHAAQIPQVHSSNPHASQKPA